ncbi:Uncharacterised protein [uncultured Comamonas sp.]|nr:Uncharacterised protein [uncultured Comamonas sp.]
MENILKSLIDKRKQLFFSISNAFAVSAVFLAYATTAYPLYRG